MLTKISLDLNNLKIINLANATESTDAVALGQLAALAFKASIDNSSLINDEVVTEAKLSTALQAKINYSAAKTTISATDPVATNDTTEGYSVGSKWYNTTSKNAFVLMDATEDAAVWVDTTVTSDDLGALALKDTIDSSSLLDNGVVSFSKIQNVSATDKLLGRSSSGAGVIEEITCTSFARSILDDADEATFKATVNLEIGTDVQAYSSLLAAIAGLTPSEGAFIVGNGTTFVTESGSTARQSLGCIGKYTADFNDSTDWAGSGPYTLTINAGTHGLGSTKALAVQVFEDGAPNEKVNTNVSVSDSGQVVITIEAAKFAGHYVIIG